jgi:hypothetical protein
VSRLDFSVVHVDAPEDEAFGPEKVTWAQFELNVDDMSITRHKAQDAFLPLSESVSNTVVGPLSGIAEWVVDHFAHVLWDAHMPAPKHESQKGERTEIPSLREAARWWDNFPREIDRRNVALWQERHTLGAAMSQLALPSIVFVPEATRIGLFVTPLARELDANVKFMLPEHGAEFWLEREDLRVMFTRLVEGVLGWATASEAQHWASWLAQRWSAAKALEESDVARRELLYGVAVARAWETRVEPLGAKKKMLEGVLADVGPIDSFDRFDGLLRTLAMEGASSSGSSDWKKLATPTAVTSARAYEQGYDLARKVRHDLDLGSDPIERVDVLLSRIDVADQEAPSGGLFRSLSCVRDKKAAVIVSDDVRGVVARRVALAGALGRLLFEAQGKDWGAAMGDQSRWQETRRASAFAAELLAPRDAVRRYASDPEGLAADYGISLASARWRIQNVLHPPV